MPLLAKHRFLICNECLSIRDDGRTCLEVREGHFSVATQVVGPCRVVCGFGWTGESISRRLREVIDLFISFAVSRARFDGFAVGIRVEVLSAGRLMGLMASNRNQAYDVHSPSEREPGLGLQYLIASRSPVGFVPGFTPRSLQRILDAIFRGMMSCLMPIGCFSGTLLPAARPDSVSAQRTTLFSSLFRANLKHIGIAV